MQVARYRDRLSGPLRDGLDMTVDVPALPPDALQDVAPGESSAAVRARVVAARERQRLRYGGTAVRTNAELTSALMSVHTAIDADGRRLLTAAMKQLSLSARLRPRAHSRAYDRGSGERRVNRRRSPRRGAAAPDAAWE
jgi:magnesium chelatase family protein